MADTDPFRNHPELRGKIKPARESYFRDMDLSVIDAQVAEAGLPDDWRTPCEEREAGRRDWLEGRLDQDLWVFGYGSLMWDPGVEFTEVRQASCNGFQRNFCLWDEGGRGTVDNPGLMLALDEGGTCEGLSFRIEAEKVDYETFLLFRREMIAPAYRPKWLNLDTIGGPIEALGFVANHGDRRIRPGIPLPVQADMISNASGLLGTNMEYLVDAYEHLKILGIEDGYVSELHAVAHALREASSSV